MKLEAQARVPRTMCNCCLRSLFYLANLQCSSVVLHYNYQMILKLGWGETVRRPVCGVLCHPWMTKVEQLVDWFTGGNLPQCCFVHHKSHMT
jgi:hypothetical protein